MSSTVRLCWLSIAFGLSFLGLHAKDDRLGLDRLTPVPATEPVPVKDFFRPRLMHSPTINPAGTHVAAIVGGADDRQQLLVYDLKTHQADVIGGRGDKDVYNIGWLDSRRLYFELSDYKMVSLGLFGTDVASVKSIYPIIQYFGQSVIGVPRENRLHPLVWLRYDQLDSGLDHGVAVVDAKVATGLFVDLNAPRTTSGDFLRVKDQNDKRILLRYPRPEGGLCYAYLPDKDGQLGFAFMSDNGQLSLQVFDGKEWKKSPLDLEDIGVIGAGHRPGEVVVRGAWQPGKPRPLLFMDALTGTPGQVILQDTTHDFHGELSRDPKTGEIVGLVFDRGGPRSLWFDDTFRALQKGLDALFPGRAAQILGTDDERKIVLVRTYSDREPTSYHWVNMEQGTAGLVRNTAPWIDPARMRPTSIIKFKTRDGLSLEAYLTMPEGASKANPPPLVVLCHGGPWARDTWGFDGEVQFLASRGYAVLQPNYRGSSSYDWMYPEEDRWDFLKMHGDVTDATRKLAAAGLVDATRMAIMGASFGGYLAISGVVHEPDLYRCAVTNAGVFDWAALLKDRKYYQHTSASYGRLVRKLGHPQREQERYAAMSPINSIERIKVPVFVAHGKDDHVAEVSQSKRLLRELDRHGVIHEKLLVFGEGHGMAHLKNQVELYERIEAFLAKNLAARTSP